MVAAADSPALGLEQETIPGVLATAARRSPEETFLIDGEAEFSFARVAEHVRRARARLSARGIEHGDRVVIWMPNGIDWVTSFFAVLGLGGIVVPAGTRLRVADLEHMLADSEARALVFAPSFLGIDFDAMVAELRSLRDDGRLPALAHLFAAGESRIEGVEPFDDPATVVGDPGPVAAEPDDLAVACYTSGTTGRPKGCLHTHTALVENARIAATLSGLRPGERIACPVPFAHVFGFHMGVVQAALAGATLVNAEPYDVEDYLDICADRRATVAYEVPTMAREVVAAQVRAPRQLNLRLALIAGAPVSPALRRATAESIAAEVSVTYGCTEAPTISQLLPSDPPEALAESVGRVTPGVEVRIARNGSDEEVPDGEVGEILVRGYNTMSGYLGDPDATARKFRDGWLVTGDLGSLDRGGFLHVCGRSDDTLLVGGFNAYPREIEAQLERLRGVDEVAVIGVPDQRLGQVPMAWIAAAPGKLVADGVLAWSSRHLASYKQPRYVRVLRRLPRVGSGKVARSELAERARAELPALPWREAAR